ncbi:S-layer homology domain-containing protein [Paenibacillus aceris]|uniref:SLH domain-containing protein n=1 Tax=Paenibacillus aceris TaxID=869555 RepID=A0ABS4I357_9BACL|nr:S-layer homology domain-containing protein [Paenibacillus aceris]MBP1965356.1 hypothetical protein [Paenibacillus aceris]
MFKKSHIFSLLFFLTMLPPLDTQASSGPDISLSISDSNKSSGNNLTPSAATLSGTHIVTAGQPFELKIGLNNVKPSEYQSVYALDLKLNYDPLKLQFESATSLKDGFQVIDTKETTQGQIRIVAASVGAYAAIQSDMLSFKFTAKSVNQATSTTVSIDHVVIANKQGNELQVNGASNEIQIKKSGNNGNGNNGNGNNGTPKPPKSREDVFNSDIVHIVELVQAIESKVEEAKNSNVKVEMADITGHWAEKTIGTFVKLRVIDGYGDGKFQPDGQITRAEFAMIISRVFGIGGGSNHSIILNDIDSHWAKQAIEKLASAGVIAGYEDGTFKPDQTINREEMVIILSRIVNFSNVDKDDSKGNFKDIEAASSFAVNPIKDAAKAGIISGKNDGMFDPQGNATRSEALAIILNALNLNSQLKTVLDSLN